MVTITAQGSDIKIDLGNGIIEYHPSGDLTQRTAGDKVELYLNGDRIHSLKNTDFTSPSGTAEQIGDAIANLFSAGGGGGDASAANQLTQISELQALNASNLAAETTGFATTALLASGATFDSGMLDAGGRTQVQTEINASHDGTIDIDFCSDAAGTDVIRSLSIPYAAADGYQFFAAPAFGNYIRYQFTNNGGVTQTDFYYTTKFLTTALSPQLLTTGAFIAPAMVATLGRNIIVGQNGTGSFANCTVVEHTNSAGTYNSLSVATGARPSELTGRTPVKIVADSTAPSSEYTVTGGKTLYVTDILLTIDNSDQNNTGRLDIYDSTVSPTTEPIVLPINVQESTNSETSVTTVTHAFIEPIEFSAGVWFEETSGTLTMTGIINGYEE